MVNNLSTITTTSHLKSFNMKTTMAYGDGKSAPVLAQKYSD